ncbi:MAG: YlxR family protein [Lachnospiraceae bacterium]|nr:YlxR family protein [Lachnospiraceae bacterium]
MAAVKKIPLRKCTGCNEMKPKCELVRVIKTADEQILMDLTGKMNGRGAYVCRSEECLKKAIKTKAIERSLGIKVSDELYDELKKELGD